MQIKKRKQLYKRNRFIRDPHDIDVLLGWDKENTFEKVPSEVLVRHFDTVITPFQMEQMFSQAAKDRISRPEQKKRKRAPASKVWISDLTVCGAFSSICYPALRSYCIALVKDIDKIYKASEIRDIIASVNV